MRQSFLALLTLALTGAASLPAAAYLTGNGLVVEPRGQDFFIPYRGESGARAFWCAAGEYAQKQLGQSPATTIFRTSEPPRRSGEGIGFSLSPVQAARSTGLATFGGQRGGLSIGLARHLCDAEQLFRR